MGCGYFAPLEREAVAMSVLKTNNLKKYYGAGAAVVKAIDGVDFTVESGEFVSVVGSSGSGKSTLLHLLGGLDRPTEGGVEVGGKEIFSMKDDELTIFRRRNIGFVFQSYNLVPLLNVEENILLPIQLDGDSPDAAYVNRVVETLGIAEKMASMPNQLSGGQQQRVALARAVASKPAIILADEPTGNLDSRTGMDVIGLLKVSGERFGQTIVLITHNPEIAQMADRTVRIEDGRIVGGR
jgi:putative ABC transport system ATP-binding protein